MDGPDAFDIKLQAAREALAAAGTGDRRDAKGKLGTFLDSVAAQQGKDITESEATTLIRAAEAIIAQL